jgi:hypothetical protein
MDDFLVNLLDEEYTALMTILPDGRLFRPRNTIRFALDPTVQAEHCRGLVLMIGGLLVLMCIGLLQVIDGIVDGVTGLVARLSAGMRPVQAGYIRNDALMFLLGVVLLIGYFVFR